MLSKLIPDGIQNGLPRLGKAAQDQHRFRGDGVDDLTNLLVVKQEVDELGDLDVIDGDNRLILNISYDQVLLFGPLIDRYIPYRNAIDAAFGECGIAKIGLN